MTKPLKFLARWLEHRAGFPLYAAVLFLVMFLAYDVLALQMGFNYDDWEGIFLYHQGFSAQQVWEYFLIDRPFSSLVHWLFHPILGTSVVGWHLLVLFLHWGAILLLVKSILELFPGHVMAAGWIGLLLGLYPGISRHFVARTSSPHYVSMFLFALSLWLMLQAIRSGKLNRKLLAVSVALGLLQSLIIEYFASMELARLFILFYFFASRNAWDWWRSLKRAFLIWQPYLGVFLVFAYFKFMLLPGLAAGEGLDSKHDVSLFAALMADPVNTILQYANLVFQDVVYVLFYVWAGPLNPTDINLAAKSYLFSWALGLFVAALAAGVMFFWARKTQTNPLPPKIIGMVAVIAALVLLLGGLPAWLIGRQGIVGLWSSRFFLAQVLGAVPLVVLLILLLTGLRRQHVANLVFAFLLAMSFSVQFREANRYTLYWDYQRDYYWQLKWRAPGLVEKTFILSPYTPFLRNADYQIAYAINLVYAPGQARTDSSYWWFDGPDTLRDYTSLNYRPRAVVKDAMRNITFESEMKYALPVLSRPSRGCLQVVADTYYQGQPGLSFEEEQMFSLANAALILPEGAPMPENVFGREPERGWCYYFQKTELARQQNDWDEINTLWKTISAQNLEPIYGPEYLPFIDLFARQGDWQQAQKLTLQAARITREASPFLCNFWQATLGAYPGFDTQVWQTVKSELMCE